MPGGAGGASGIGGIPGGAGGASGIGGIGGIGGSPGGASGLFVSSSVIFSPPYGILHSSHSCLAHNRSAV